MTISGSREQFPLPRSLSSSKVLFDNRVNLTSGFERPEYSYHEAFGKILFRRPEYPFPHPAKSSTDRMRDLIRLHPYIPIIDDKRGRRNWDAQLFLYSWYVHASSIPPDFITPCVTFPGPEE